MEAYGDGEAWGALGDQTRRSIVMLLAEGPSPVGKLAEALPVSRPAVSQHLKVLKDAGLVDEEAEGTRRIYRLNEAGLLALRDQLDTWLEPGVGRLPRHRRTTRGDRMSTTDATAVGHEITVEASQQRAFEAFTKQFGDFKPKEHNLLGSPIVETTFEPRVGGHIYDRAEDGSECRWARVLAFDPPERVVFSWDISPYWQLEADQANASEVEVRFIAEGPDRTRVELEHRNLDRHGQGWEGVRDGVDGDGGWPTYLARYGEVVATA